MSSATFIMARSLLGRQALVFAILATISLGATATAPGQEADEKKVGERVKEFWGKMVAKMEAGSKSAGDEYHKLKDEAASASGPAREKLAAEMEVASRKWAAAREKLATSVELRMHAIGEEYKALEEKAGKASGPARAKMADELDKLGVEWHEARAKMEATLSSNLKWSREEIKHLEEHFSSSTKDARAKLAPHLDRLKAEFHRDREKLGEYLEADLKQTKEDMEKLGEATSQAASRAKEKLSVKYRELHAKIEALAEERKSKDSD